MITKIHICSWCKKSIVNKMECRTIRKNGKTEHFHYSQWKDCLADKIRAIAIARKLLENEDR